MARFTPRPEVAQRRARVLALRLEQRTYAEIGTALGISAKVAEADYRRSLEQLKRDQDTAAAHTRAVELAKLDLLEREAWRVLRTRHITVQQGKIVGKFTGFAADPDTGETYRGDDGKPIPLFEEIEDDAPVLAAIDRLERIARRRAALLGLDAPVKIEVSDEVDAEIRRLAAELAAGVGNLERAGETQAAGDPAAG